MDSPKIFREMRAKKAKYGFSAHVNRESIFYISEPCLFTRAHQATIEVMSFGSMEVKIYTDDDFVAENFRNYFVDQP